MTGPFGVPQRRRNPAINLTPLIDVMFLLLIFFMVSSTFKEDLGIDITLPEAESASNQEITAHQVTVDREGKTYYGGTEMSPEALRARLEGVLVEDPEASIVLRADDGADFGRVLRIIDIARELEAANLVIPTEPMAGAITPR